MNLVWLLLVSEKGSLSEGSFERRMYTLVAGVRLADAALWLLMHFFVSDVQSIEDSQKGLDTMQRLADFLISNNAIMESEREFFLYGCKQFIFLMTFIISTLIIGIILDLLPQTLLFISSYSLLRSYAGGWHFRSPLRCLFFSIAIVPIILVFSTYTSTVFVLLLIGSSTVVFLLSPIDDPNKRLDAKEIRIYRLRARICVVLILLSALIWRAPFPYVSNIFILAITLVAFLQIVARVINSRCPQKPLG